MPSSYGYKGKQRQDDRDDDEAPQAEPDDIERPPGLVNKGIAPFGFLCGVYETLENANRTGKSAKPGYKGDIIKKLYTVWRDKVGMDLYPLLRLLLPERDTRRRTYNLKEQKLAKAIVTALDLPPESADARKLINWKVPTKEDQAAGEFATVAFSVIESRSSVIEANGSMSVDDVNTVLDEISRTVPKVGADGKKKNPAKQHAQIIKNCISVMTPKEMKWFIRIILRDLKAGVREKTILSNFHDDAVDVFNTCSDIKRVCWQLWDPDKHMPRTDWMVTPNRTFIPMFCHRLTGGLRDIVTMMKKGRPPVDPTKPLEPGAYSNDEFLIEEKLDGERIQLHKTGSQFRYYSRKAKDYTYMYGADEHAGSLTPYIADLISDEVQDLILDGEMLVWDPSLVRYMPFGNLKTFAIPGHKDIQPNDPRPCFKVFDVLYVSGKKTGEYQSCLQMPLWRRKAFLSTLFKPKKGIMELADCVRASTDLDIKTYLEQIVEERGEGLVIKHPLSMYCLGARNESWIKVKPEYMDALGETIDAVVIGGYWGEGRRGGGLSSFLVGLRVPNPDDDDNPKFVSFAKVGSGLNREDYSWISSHVGSKLRPIKKGDRLPDWFVTRVEMPDVLIDPKDSFVVEIKAAAIVGGADYGAEMTLRFPRAMRIRYDRTYLDSADLESVNEMTRASSKRDHVGETFTIKKKSKAPRTTKVRAVAPDLTPVAATSQIFTGLTVYVHSGGKKASDKLTITNKIRQHGAKVIQTVADTDDRLVIAADMKGGLSRKKGVATTDVVDPSWVLESIESGRRLPLYKRFVISATPATIESLDYTAPEKQDEDDQIKVEKNDGSDDDMEFLDREEKNFAPPMSSNLDRPRTPAVVIGSDDEDEPETENDGEGEDDEIDSHDGQDDDEATPPPLSSTFINAMARQRLETRSPTLEPVDLVGYFSPYTAYFDTEANATRNDLSPSSQSYDARKRSDEKLVTAQTQFSKLGGTVTNDLSHPFLTHIIMSSDDVDRRIELHRRTKEPKLRRIVTQDWILRSVEGDTVLDETQFIA